MAAQDSSDPAFTDLKLHDITSGPNDPNRETLDMNEPASSEGFFAGNSKFLTRKLWDLANKPNFFHHGQFTTIRQAVLAHMAQSLADAPLASWMDVLACVSAEEAFRPELIAALRTTTAAS